MKNATTTATETEPNIMKKVTITATKMYYKLNLNNVTITSTETEPNINNIIVTATKMYY